jgi:PAB1-binding protein PBP1
MYTRVLKLTISAIILAYGAVGALAQDRMMPQPVQQQAQSQPTDQEGSGMMRHGGMMAGGMMGHGTMGPPPVMLRMMFALIDTDSDGTISLQEFQAAHERIFKAMDTNKDGKLTPEEMQAFIAR